MTIFIDLKNKESQKKIRQNNWHFGKNSQSKNAIMVIILYQIKIF